METENDMFSNIEPRYIAISKRGYKETLKGIKSGQELGVQLLAGTDVVAPYTYPGFSLHDELGLLVEAGLTPLQSCKLPPLSCAILGLRTWAHRAGIRRSRSVWTQSSRKHRETRRDFVGNYEWNTVHAQSVG